MAKTLKVALRDLLLNGENYRFETVAGQKEAIDKMIEDQKEKLFNLAEHIAVNGLNPNDRIQVVRSSHDRKKYIVLEGNRRVLSLKLIDNPGLIDSPSFSNLKKKFRQLHDKNGNKMSNQIECTLYDDPSEGDVWIKIKHAGQSEGVGTVGWNAQQVQRFDEKLEGKSSIALQTINLLKGSDDVPNEIKNKLNNLKITNLSRLLDDPDVRNFLGIEINNGVLQSEIEESEVVKGLTQITKDILAPKFSVKKIYTKEDRQDYLNSFPASMAPALHKKSSQPWQFTKSGQPVKTNKKSISSKPDSRERKHLIPKSCVLQIPNPKINSIYHELQKNLDLHKLTNAGAVLFRVFVELSMDCYIEKYKPSGANIDTPLRNKVSAVSTHLEQNKLADKHMCKGIRNAVNDRDSLMGIETWNAYVHNPRFSPTYQALNTTWDNMQTFIEKLWESIN